MKRHFVVLGLSLFAIGCVTQRPPVEEFALARTALQAAQRHDSARYASGFWQLAEENYRTGEKFFQKGEYTSAKDSFDRSKFYSEKAENQARLQKFKTGEGVP